MGKLISLVSNTRKQSEKIAIEVQKILKNKGYKVVLVLITVDTAPAYTESPYISSLYDINARYAQKKAIESKLKTNDYVIALGYIEETIVRELSKLNSEKEFKNYSNWIINIERNTYAIKPADSVYLVTNYPQDTLNILSKMNTNKYNILSTKSSVNKIVKSILSLKINPEPLGNSTLYDVINLTSYGIQVDYRNSDNPINDKGLQELMAANKLISKKLKGTSYYIENITKPLGTPVYINNFSRTIPQHTKGMVDLFNTFMEKYRDNNEYNIEITSHPKNEIELSNLIAENYGLSKNVNLKYTERMRIIENWAMQPNRIILDSYFSVEINTILSFYDLLLLNSICKPIILWQPISAINGYVDCSSPASVDSIVQEVFDTATVLSATTTKNPENYLLLGHKLLVKLKFSWKDIEFIYKTHNIKGSELLDALIISTRNYFEEKFPIYTMTITNKK